MPAEGDKFTCLAEILSATVQDNRGRRGPREILSFTFRVGDTTFTSALFGNVRMHLPFVTPGAKLMLSGTLSLYRDQWQLKNPSYITLHPAPTSDGHRMTDQEYDAAFGAFGPLATIVDVAGGMKAAQRVLSHPWLTTYRRRPGPSSAEVTAVMDHVLALMGQPSDMLPRHPGTPTWPHVDGEPIIDFATALHDIHRPGEQGPHDARTRLKFNEALALQLVMALRRADTTARQARAVVPVTDQSRYNRVAQSLPYVLTDTQQDALTKIGNAMQGDSGAQEQAVAPMSMLLQGDVGSGKTVVALLAMLRVVDSGAQCAFLAPTEVLAAQHAETLRGLLDVTRTHGDTGRLAHSITVTLLTGTMSAAARREALLDIVSGTSDIVIGTHAIIQDTVEFFDLGLVVVDEQHRFGVRQRDHLREKSPVERTPHLLVMTATPIPRTVAMTMFGDLSLCTLTGAPSGRGEVSTFVVPTGRPRWIQRVYAVIREQAALGHRTFIVVPRIEGEGGVDDVADRLLAGPLAGLRLGRLHGRMDGKTEVMAQLASGELDVLVATTVIPQATVMVVTEAENFGVSQLHQLRGRVGRGSDNALCFLCTGIAEDQASFHRLEAIAGTSDGFALAELDLRTRTEGDVLGESQSGARTRRVALLSLADDASIIVEARRYAEDLVAYDPALSRALVADFGTTDQDFIERT